MKSYKILPRAALLPTITFAILVVLFSQANVTASETVRIDVMPSDIDGYAALQKQHNTPEGAAACFVVAMLTYENSAPLARAFFTLSLTDVNLIDGPNGHGGRQPDVSYQDHIDMRLKRDPGMARSYVQGTSRNDNYVLPPQPYEFVFTRNPRSVESDNLIRVYLASTGADTPRPVLLLRGDDGLWRVDGASSLFVGVAAPQAN